MLDFNSVRTKKISLAQLGAGLSVDDLHRLTDEMIDTVLESDPGCRGRRRGLRPLRP